MNSLKKQLAILQTLAWLLTAASPLVAGEKALVQDGSVRYKLYTVKEGDSIWKISEKELQNAARWKEILVPDRISISPSTPDLIHPGQMLFLPFQSDLSEDDGLALPPAASDSHTGGAGAPAEQTDAIKQIMVREFTYENKTRGYDWIPSGLTETLTADLGKIPGITVVDRKKPDATSLADAILFGNVAAEKGRIRIRAALARPAGGEIIAEAEISGSYEHLIDLSRLTLIKLLDRAMDLSGDAQAAIMGRDKTSFSALENISKAKLMNEKGNSKEAKELYRRALESDPTNSTALERLKENLSPSDALAILPLANVTGRKENDWLGNGIAETLTTDLKKATGVNIVERMQVEKTLSELKLSSISGLVDDKTAPKVGKMTGAAIVLIGSYQVEMPKIRIDIRMVDVASGIVLLTESAGGAYSGLFEVEAQLAEKIVSALNVQLTPEQKQTMAAGKPDLETFKQHIIATSSVSIEKKKNASTRVSSLAILKFENASKTPDFDWLCSALPGSLTTDITTQAHVPLVERMQIDRALEELKLASVGVVAADSAPKIGKIVGADALISGSFQVSGDKIRIDSTIIKVETGEIVGSAQVSGQASNVLALQKKLADEMLIALGVKTAKTAAAPKPTSESWSKIKKFEGEKERELKMRRAYRFEASGRNKTILRDTIEDLKDLPHEDALSDFNKWVPSIRGLKPPENASMVIKEGDFAPYTGFLIPREFMDRIFFMKTERDLCIQGWDEQVTGMK